jgi:hypothetical protein
MPALLALAYFGLPWLHAQLLGRATNRGCSDHHWLGQTEAQFSCRTLPS